MPRECNQSTTTEMVYKILNFMNKEAQEGLQYDIKGAHKRTALVTGVSESTIWRIVDAAKKSNNPSSSVPSIFQSNKRKQREKKVTGIDNFNKGVIKRISHNFYKTEKELPTLKNLLKTVKQEVGFTGSLSSLRRILLDLGFKWKDTKDKKKLLIEHINIRIKRIEFLQKISKYREENRPIVYTDEMYIDSLQILKGERLIVVYAGSEAGFMSNSLFMFKANTRIGDFRNNITYENYENWIRTQLMPNLPENSVVVVNNTHYTNKVKDAAPTSNSNRCRMESWLRNKNIPFHSAMLKPELYRLICFHKEKFKKYAVDCILAEKNHTILRVPPYHPDINPVQLAGVQIKSEITKKIATWDIYNVMQIVVEQMSVMGEQEWIALFEKVKNIEEEYKKSDSTIDNLTEKFVICVESDTKDKDSESSNSSSGEEESSDTEEEDSEML